MIKLSFTDSLKILHDDNALFRTFLTHGTLTVELYQPHNVDLQKPHERDEIYVVSSGKSHFTVGVEDYDVINGDVLFVAAGVEHRFSNFSDDFANWVFFTDLKVASSKRRFEPARKQLSIEDSYSAIAAQRRAQPTKVPHLMRQQSK